MVQADPSKVPLDTALKGASALCLSESGSYFGFIGLQWRCGLTIFELVKIALDGLYLEGQRAYGNSLDAEIRSRIAYLSSIYRDLGNGNRQPVDYRDPATRFAYVYKYVAAHGDYIVQALIAGRSANREALFLDQTIRVSCIGGGPGSDIVGILKYLDDYRNYEPVKKVICYLLDREQAWADTWVELDESINADVALHANFQPLDVARPDSWKFQRKFLEADLFTLSYFVSEVYALDGDGTVSRFLEMLFTEARSDAWFVYLDNGHANFTDYFDAKWRAAGLSCVASADDVSLIPRFSEQASELAEYQAKFGQSPKIRSYISYRVLRKPAG